MLLRDPVLRKILGRVEINTIIRKIEGKKLKQPEKNYLCRSIRPKLIAAKLLSDGEILKKINKKRPNKADIIEYNISVYGYPMIILKKEKRFKKIPLEELIATILTIQPSARYIESIPVLIAKNKMDEFKMLEIACKFDIKNKLGYLIETAMMIKKLPYLDDLLHYLMINKDEKISFLTDGDFEFLSRTSPERVRKWNLLGRFFDEDFRKNAEAYS